MEHGVLNGQSECVPSAQFCPAKLKAHCENYPEGLNVTSGMCLRRKYGTGICTGYFRGALATMKMMGNASPVWVRSECVMKLWLHKCPAWQQ